MLLANLVFAFVAAPSRRTASTTATAGEAPSNASAAVFGGFVWLLIIGLLVALLVAYLG